MPLVKAQQIVCMSGKDDPLNRQDVLINTDAIVIVVPAKDLMDPSHEACSVAFVNGKILFFEGTVEDFRVLIAAQGVK